MKLGFSTIFKLLIVQFLSSGCLCQDFEFFYFVQQWPGSYCDTSQSCCYPRTGKPEADFGIHGLWPYYNDGSFPSNCDPDSVFDKSQISDLVSSLQQNWPTLACPSSDGTMLWSNEWDKHGTCSESELDQHDYFQAALQLKQKVSLPKILKDAGIEPDDGLYDLQSIEEAIKEGVGFSAGIECNVDASNNSQLYLVYLCVDTSGSNLIDCPVMPKGGCASTVQFPKF